MAGVASLVLAGRRGEGDPLAREARVSHRALLPVAGVPMLLRVVRALRASAASGPLWVSADRPALLRTVPELAALAGRGSLILHESLDSPSRSVLDVLQRLGVHAPLLVTTADHALLRPEMVNALLAAGERSAADLLVGLVERRVVEERFPETRRTWLRLRDGHYTGANLFLFRTADARRAAAFYLRAERHRKRPWRWAGAFGLGSLALFALGRLDLPGALARASRAMGARVEAVALPFPEAAVDVDHAADLALVERVLAPQSTRSPAAANSPVAGS